MCQELDSPLLKGPQRHTGEQCLLPLQPETEKSCFPWSPAPLLCSKYPLGFALKLLLSLEKPQALQVLHPYIKVLCPEEVPAWSLLSWLGGSPVLEGAQLCCVGCVGRLLSGWKLTHTVSTCFQLLVPFLRSVAFTFLGFLCKPQLNPLLDFCHSF